MSQDILFRILGRSEIASFMSSIGDRIGVLDCEGDLLFGTEGDGKSYPIMGKGENIGMVRGSGAAEAVALLFSQIASHEIEGDMLTREEEAQLREVTLAISTELHLPTLLPKIMDATVSILDADRSTLFLNDETTGELWSPVAQGVKSGEIRFGNHLGIAGQVFSSGQTLNIPDAYADDRFNREMDRKTGYRTESILCCPVINREGKVIGVTQVLNKKHGSFTSRDINRLMLFSAQAAIAIENAQLYENLEMKVRERTRELRHTLKHLSSELQEAADYVTSLLPEPLDKGEITTDWRFVPSSSLGGDSFGYHWLDKDRFAIYLIDVSGHGVGAALLSVSVMNVLRSQTLPDTDFTRPEQVLASLNLAFPMEKQKEMFFTMWYGVYNRSTKSLDYASAGHPAALLFPERNKGRENIRQLRTPNMFIGAVPGLTYQVEQQTIEEPSRLLVYSDGVYEIQKDDGGDWTFQEFVDFMMSLNGSGGSDMDALMDHTLKISGTTTWDDDFSILEVRFP